MRKNEMEKSQLIERINEQSETVHQLTHHIHLLQSSQEADASHPVPELNVTAGTFGGKFPLFFNKQSEQKAERTAGLSSTGHVHNSEPWPLSDHIDQANSINMSQLSSSSAAQDQSFTTAPPPSSPKKQSHLSHPSTAVKNGMHELYLRNRDVYEKAMSGTPYQDNENKIRNSHAAGRCNANSNSGQVKDSPSIRPMISNAFTPLASSQRRDNNLTEDNSNAGKIRTNRRDETER